MLELKPSHKPIKEYFAALAEYRTHGVVNEMSIRNAFQDLLQTYAKKVGWFFVEEYAIKRKGRRDASVDGALLDQFSLARAFWEAKDTKDDLRREVANKFADGYPSTNILFWQPGRVILFQGGAEVLDEQITKPEKLVEILHAFFNYDQPYIREWEHAVEEFKNTIPTLAKSVLTILEKQRSTNTGFKTAFDRFMELAKQSINPSLSVHAVEEMLIQHLLTRRIFQSIFNSPGFVQKNAVARELEGVVSALVQGYGTVEDFLKPLDRFYRALEMAAAASDDYSEKQAFLNHVYEKFFQGFAVKVADTHGIVYTPQPIVDFMVKSVESVLQKDFGKGLASKGVHILDPFVGTGNFVLRVMREIHAQDAAALRYKYLNELHCNEVMLLPYYIACLNIEHLYFELTGQYESFPGICLVDTFELVEDKQMGMFTSDNTDRVQRQKESPIYVVIGNPPYNGGQVNENDNNKNRKYPAIDARVKETYVKDSKATYRADLSDPYVKAFRFASDKIAENGEGVVCFVTNSGYLEGIAFDGMRKHLRRDFDNVSILDLGGNVRKNPKLSGTTHNVFGIQVGVAIALLELHGKRDDELVRYSRMDEFFTRRQKYAELARQGDITSTVFDAVIDRDDSVWLTHGMADDWSTLIPLGSKGEGHEQRPSLFANYSYGIISARDSWVFSYSRDVLKERIRQLVLNFNAEVAQYHDILAMDGRAEALKRLTSDERRVKWTDRLLDKLHKNERLSYDDALIRPSSYRPFCGMHVYFDELLIHRRYQFPKIFPTSTSDNLVIGVNGVGSEKSFAPFAANAIMNGSYYGGGTSYQCFPLWLYNENGQTRIDGLTDWGLDRFRSHYDDKSITKLDIFNYVYGILHSPLYREKYAANLRRELPRVPFANDFNAYVDAGKQLLSLHINYEDQLEYPLTEAWTEGKSKDYRVIKMKRDKNDATNLVYNESLTIVGLPILIDEYKLGNRSALNWVIDQYQVSSDKRSGIVNDPNRIDDPTYIVRLIKKVVTVSMETRRIVEALPPL